MDENTMWKKKRFRHNSSDKKEKPTENDMSTFDKIQNFFEKSEKIVNETEMIFDQLSKLQDKKTKREEIKKQKGKKKLTNYKNVKVLDNIYEKDADEKDKMKESQAVESFQEGLFYGTDEKIKRKIPLTKPVTKPGVRSKPITKTIPPSIYQNPLFPKMKCGPNPFTEFKFDIKNPEKGVDLINKRVDYVMCVFKYIIEIFAFMFTFIAVYIYMLVDPTSKTKDADIQLIKKHVNIFFIMPIAIYISYNWFLLLFYKDESLTRLDREKEFNTFVNLNIPDSVISVFNYLFYYLTRPLYVFDKLLCSVIPWIILSLKDALSLNIPILSPILNPLSLLLNPVFLFIALCTVITVLLAKHSKFYLNLFNTYLRLNTKGDMKLPFTGLYFGIIFVFILLAFFPTTIAERTELIKNQMFWGQTLASMLFKFLFILSFTQTCGLFIIFYLIIVSLFSFTFFNKSVVDVKNFINKSIDDMGKENCPDDLGFWQKIMKYVCLILSNCLYPYHEILYILFFIVGMFIYLQKMGSYKGKITFVLIHMFFIYTFSLILYHLKLKRLFEE